MNDSVGRFSNALGYSFGLASPVNESGARSPRFLSHSCFPFEISCGTLCVNLPEKGFLSNPILIFAPEKAVRNPEAANR